MHLFCFPSLRKLVENKNRQCFRTAKRFKYTHGGGVLTKEQLQFYEDNGYIIMRNNVNHRLLDQLQQRFIDVCEGRIDRGPMSLIKDASLKHQPGVGGEYVINKLQNFLHDDVFYKFASDKSITNVVSSVIGPNITAIHSMVINKPPNADPRSSLHPIHQDLHYFPVRPVDKIVASWTAMQSVDESNGCRYVVPGSHKGELLPHSYLGNFKNKLYHGIGDLDHLPRVHVPMEKGDTIFFHPILIHGSGPNHTKRFRKALSVHYADSDCYFIDVKGTIQEEVFDEIEDWAKTEGTEFNLAEYCNTKSRLIAGTPRNFQKCECHLK